jgi:hypothetical protein
MTFDDAFHLSGMDVTFGAFVPLGGDDVTLFWHSTLTHVALLEHALII